MQNQKHRLPMLKNFKNEGISMAITSFMISALESLVSYAMMAALCRSIAKRNPSEDLIGINHVKYSYAFGLIIMFFLEFFVVSLKLEMPEIDKMWKYSSLFALIPSCFMSMLEVHKNPENSANRSMRAILFGIVIFIIVGAFITKQVVKKGSEEFQKNLIEKLGKDHPDFKIALEKTIEKGINPNIDLKKEIQDSFNDLLKDTN